MVAAILSEMEQEVNLTFVAIFVCACLHAANGNWLRVNTCYLSQIL